MAAFAGFGAHVPTAAGSRCEFLGTSQPAPAYKCRQRPSRRQVLREDVVSQYLDTSTISVDWSRPDRKGSFGRVFFGTEATSGANVVIKCPVESDIGRTLYNIEEHTNSKLARMQRRKQGKAARWADYLGKIIVPRDAALKPGLSRIGLVWRRAGEGATMEEYLNANRIPELERIVGRVGAPHTNYSGMLRVTLAERVLLELVLLLKDLDDAGVIHRDIKPDNLIVVTEDDGQVPLRCIDFGSSCDWQSPFKVGLRTATCDPFYTAPERKLNVMAANRFDVYSVGLITLRCLFPSLTSRRDMERFVAGDLQKSKSFDSFINLAIAGRMGTPGGTQAEAKILDSEPRLQALRSLLSVMLTVKPSDRADVNTCLNSRLLADRVSSVVR